MHLLFRSPFGRLLAAFGLAVSFVGPPLLLRGGSGPVPPLGALPNAVAHGVEYAAPLALAFPHPKPARAAAPRAPLAATAVAGTPVGARPATAPRLVSRIVPVRRHVTHPRRPAPPPPPAPPAPPVAPPAPAQTAVVAQVKPKHGRGHGPKVHGPPVKSGVGAPPALGQAAAAVVHGNGHGRHGHGGGPPSTPPGQAAFAAPPAGPPASAGHKGGHGPKK